MKFYSYTVEDEFYSSHRPSHSHSQAFVGAKCISSFVTSWFYVLWKLYHLIGSSFLLYKIKSDEVIELGDFKDSFRRRKWQPSPVFLPGESQGWGSLAGYSPWGHRVRHDWNDLATAGAAGTPLALNFKCIVRYIFIAHSRAQGTLPQKVA